MLSPPDLQFKFIPAKLYLNDNEEVRVPNFRI